MKRQSIFLGLAAIMLAVTSAAAHAQSANCPTRSGPSSFGMVQRDYNRNLERSRVEMQNQVLRQRSAKVVDEDVYGDQLMSKRELRRYFKKLQQLAEDSPERSEFLAEHRARMQSRAARKGIDLETLESAQASLATSTES